MRVAGNRLSFHNSVFTFPPLTFDQSSIWELSMYKKGVVVLSPCMARVVSNKFSRRKSAINIIAP